MIVRFPAIAFLALCVLFSASAFAEKRVALVVGNSSYKLAPLDNPKNDADDISVALSRLGFEVTERKDLTVSAFDQTLDDFVEAAKGKDVALFYFSGHGVQIDKRGFLAPIDFKAESESAALRELVSIQEVVARIENAANVSVIVLDACRDSPLQERLRRIAVEKNRALVPPKGLPAISVVGSNTLIVYATVPGETASDGGGRNSPFTSAFLKNVEVPGLDIELIFKRVTADVLKVTGGKQQPERLSRLQSELVLLPSPMGAGFSQADELDTLRKRLAALEAAAKTATKPPVAPKSDGKSLQYEAVPQAASPETGKPSGSPSSESKPADIWYKLCPTAANCETRVDVRDNETALKIGSLAIRSSSSQHTLSAVLPLGSALPVGALVKIDDHEPVRLAYERCYKNGCYAEASVDASFLADMKQGKQVAYIGIAVTGKTLTVPLPLDGFGIVYDSPPTTMRKYWEDQKKIVDVIRDRSKGKIQTDAEERQLGTWKPSDLKRRAADHGPWYKLCIDVPAPDTSKPNEKTEDMRKVNVCLTQVDIRDRDTSVLVAKIAIRQAAGQDKPQILAMVPLGGPIQEGVSVESDAGPAIQLAFTTCDQVGCYAEASIEPSYVGKLKRGGQLSFTTADEAGAPAPLDVQLDGFARAIDGPATPIAKYNEDQRKIAEVIRERLSKSREHRSR